MSRQTKKTKISIGNEVVFGSSVLSSQSGVFNHSVSVARTLHFHTGTHKTGSTALQVYLAANKELLGKSGVSYSFPEGADQSMGNGQYLYEHIYERNMQDSQLDELLEYYLAGQSMAICSSEDFTRFKLQEWRQINDACQRLQVQVRVVTFVRDIGPYYFSLHSQLIKGGEIHTSFAEFCKWNQYYPVLDSIKCLLDVFGRESMSVIHYESVIDNLDIAFMQTVGLSADQYDSSPLKLTVNRSLTEYEQERLSFINKTTGRQYSHELSDLLLRRRPYLKSLKRFNQEIIEILTVRHSSDVGWLNQIIFGCSGVVRICDKTLSNASNKVMSEADQQAIDRDVANWCMSKLQAMQEESIKFITARLLAIDWGNAGNPVVPKNFDPIAYLLLNLDVLKAGVPPYEHFIHSGQYERRKWEWSNQ